MQESHRGLLSNYGAWIGIIGLVILIIAAGMIPVLFSDQLGDYFCPDGTQLESYSFVNIETDSTTNGHACYRADGTVAKDLGRRIVNTSVGVAILSFMGIVILVVFQIYRSMRPRVAQDEPYRERNPELQAILDNNEQAIERTNHLGDLLEQIEVAYKQGLLTDEEYERKRREIMDAF